MWRKFGIFLLLCFVTLLAYCTVDRFTEIGEQLLVNHDFASGYKGWQAGGPASAIAVNLGLVRIQSGDAQVSAQLSQRLDPALLGERVVLKGEIKTLGIKSGKKPWEKGRVLLVQYVDGKASYSTPHGLVALDGTHDWSKYSAVFSILPSASEARVVLQLSHCTGELQVKDLTLFRVIKNPAYRIVRWVVFCAWGLFMISVFIPGVVRNCGGKKWSVLAVLVVIVILLGTTVPGWLKTEAKDELLSRAKTYTNEMVKYGGSKVERVADEVKAQKWLRIDITKVAHFLLFALLGGLLYVRRGRGFAWPTLVDAGMLACGTELAQLFIDGRSALVGDVLIDLAGAAFAILLLRTCTIQGRKTHTDKKWS